MQRRSVVVGEAHECDRGSDSREQLRQQVDAKRRPRDNRKQGIVEADAGIECAVGDGADHDGARDHAEGDWPGVVVIDAVTASCLGSMIARTLTAANSPAADWTSQSARAVRGASRWRISIAMVS